MPVYTAKAHKEIVNSIDGVGGLGIGEGAPEIVTGSRDGMSMTKVFNCSVQSKRFQIDIPKSIHVKKIKCLIIVCFKGTVKVWDPRQKDSPVANMEPMEGETKRDCWTVAFGR